MTSKVNFKTLNKEQKVNYIKNLLFNSDINSALSILLEDEKKNLEIIKLIDNVLEEELIINRVKEQCNLSDNKKTKIYVYSRIISILSFYKKTIILNNFFKMLNLEDLKSLAIYEYQNKTEVSFSNTTFNKYCKKYKEEAEKLLNPTDEETLMLTTEIKKYNNISKLKPKKTGKQKLFILFGIFFFLIMLILGYKYYEDSKLLKKYDGLIYPGIYLNDNDLSNITVSSLEDMINNEKKRIESGTITISNINGEYKFTYKEVGISVNNDDIIKEIIDYNKNLPRYKKVRMIKNSKRVKTFYLTGKFSGDSINNFMAILNEKLNVEPRNDGLVVDKDYNVTYDKGANGFTLNKEETEIKVKKALSNLKENTTAKAVGKVVKNEIKYESLSSINKKISSHTTYFANQGNRGHNITLASSRLNDTTLMPGETFSYLKTVGPYGASNGYLPAPIYLNSAVSTANGGGVCQLASTLYMAQLKAGLQTVYRTGHTFAPNYVPRGLDATVYSTTTDFKFKNNYEYPFYIVSYVKGNYLTVDIWSNDKALDGKMFEPYSVYSNGGYLAYLKIIKDGKRIETKYLDKSVYKEH